MRSTPLAVWLSAQIDYPKWIYQAIYADIGFLNQNKLLIRAVFFYTLAV